MIAYPRKANERCEDGVSNNVNVGWGLALKEPLDGLLACLSRLRLRIKVERLLANVLIHRRMRMWTAVYRRPSDPPVGYLRARARDVLPVLINRESGDTELPEVLPRRA